MTCDWCVINAGRTHANRPCCKVRMLAQAPTHTLKAYAETLTQDERDALRPKLAAEKKRLRELKK